MHCLVKVASFALGLLSSVLGNVMRHYEPVQFISFKSVSSVNSTGLFNHKISKDIKYQGRVQNEGLTCSPPPLSVFRLSESLIKRYDLYSVPTPAAKSGGYLL